MKRNITFNERESEELRTFVSLINDIRRMAEAPLQWLCSYYSYVIGKDISRKQSAWITITEVAFIVALLPIGNVLVHAATIAVFVMTLEKCRQMLSK